MPPLNDDQYPHAPSTLLSSQLWIRKRYVLEHVNESRLAQLVRNEKKYKYIKYCSLEYRGEMCSNKPKKKAEEVYTKDAKLTP